MEPDPPLPVPVQPPDEREAWDETRARVVEVVGEREPPTGVVGARPVAPVVSSPSPPLHRDPAGVVDKNHPGPEPAESAPAVVSVAEAPSDHWFQGARADVSYANHLLLPLSPVREGADESRLTTAERYDIAPIHLYRAALAVDTQFARVEVAYESDRGLSIGGPPSSLLDVVVALTGVPALERLSLAYRDLDFRYGRAELVTRGGDDVLQRADFTVRLRQGELRYRLPLGPGEAEDGGAFLLGRYMSYALPRNVHLGEDRDGATVYHQVSEHLHLVDSDLWMLGGGWSTPSGSSWDGGLRLAFGFGPYELRTLTDGAHLDEGTMSSAFVGGHLGYRLWLTEALSVGVRDELTFTFAAPVGLPDGLEQDLKDEGLDPSGFSLEFGGVEVVNCATVYLVVEI